MQVDRADSVGLSEHLVVATVRPFERRVVGVTLRMRLDPTTRTAVTEQEGVTTDATERRAVETVRGWMVQRLRRFLGEDWQVL